MSKTQTKLVRWGHSRATRIPSQIIKELNLNDNQKLDIEIQNNKIILTPSEPNNIHDLFANWQDDGKRDREVDWGSTKGEEIW